MLKIFYTSTLLDKRFRIGYFLGTVLFKVGKLYIVKQNTNNENNMFPKFYNII